MLGWAQSHTRASVRAIGELAEFVLQSGDALLLRLHRLLQHPDLLQHLVQDGALWEDTKGRCCAYRTPPWPSAPEEGDSPVPHPQGPSWDNISISQYPPWTNISMHQCSHGSMPPMGRCPCRVPHPLGR